MTRHGKKWRIALTALCLSLLTGCGKTDPILVPVPVPLTLCVEPVRPERAQLDSASMFDELDNARILMEQDDAMREYIKGLLRTLRCYRAQIPQDAQEATQ